MGRTIPKGPLLLLAIVSLLIGPQAVGQPPLIEQGKRSRPVAEQARQLMNAGLYQKAQWLIEDELRDLSRSERRDELLFLLLESYFKQQRFEEAYQTSRQFLAEQPTGERRMLGFYYQGISAHHTERFDVAAHACETFAAQGSSHPLLVEVYYWRALSELERGNAEGAEEYAHLSLERMSVQGAESKRVGKENVLLIVALAKEHQGEIVRAIELLEQFVKDYPTGELIGDARIRLVALYLRKGEFHNALSHLRAVEPKTSRQRHEWLFLSAEVEFWMERYPQAIARYRELLHRFPAGTFARQARHGLAWALLWSNMPDDAKREFRQLITVNDSITQTALYQIGVISLLQNNTAEAVDAFEQLGQRFPYDDHADNAYFHLGMIRYRANQYPEARRNFQLAARLFPRSEIRAESYRMLGEASLAVGDLSYAQYAFSQVRKLAAEARHRMMQAPAETGMRYERKEAPTFVEVDHLLLAAAMFQEGVALYHLGRFNSSADRFDEFVRAQRNHPRLGEAHVWRGEALYQAGKFDEAEQAFTAALEKLRSADPKRAEALYGLSWSLFEQKKFRRAIASFDRFLDENPKNERVIEATLRKADCYFFLRDYEIASELYASLAQVRRASRSAEYAAFQLGMSFIQRGETERGVEHLRGFLQRHSESMYVEVAHFNIAWAYFSREQYQRANEDFRRFEQKYPESQLMPRVLLNSGDAFYNLAMYDSARVYYQRLIEAYPTSLLLADAINGLQFTYQAQGRGREAVAAIDTLIAGRSNAGGKEDLVLQKADILFGQGDFGQAAMEYLRTLELRPSNSVKARALHQLGRIYEFEHNHTVAASFFERVAAEFPESELAPTSLLSLGNMSMKQSQWTAAITRFVQFEERYSASPLLWEALYNVGVCHTHLKNMDAARKQFEKVIERAPTDEVFADRSRLQIARMLQSRKQHAAAIDALLNVVQRRDDGLSAEALLLMGENYLALKKPADALEAFSQAVEGFAQYPLLVERGLLGSGECYERLNDRTRARSAYDKVVATAIDPAIKKDAQDRLRRLRR